jgi:hypothetical protein
MLWSSFSSIHFVTNLLLPPASWYTGIPVLRVADNRARAHLLGTPQGTQLQDCSLDVSMQPEGPATAISTQGFLGFPCLHADAEMVPKFRVATACFSCSPPDLNHQNLTPCVGGSQITFTATATRNSPDENPRSLSAMVHVTM